MGSKSKPVLSSLRRYIIESLMIRRANDVVRYSASSVIIASSSPRASSREYHTLYRFFYGSVVYAFVAPENEDRYSTLSSKICC